MTTLSDGSIRHLCEGHVKDYKGIWRTPVKEEAISPLITPFNMEQLQPASYDLVLDHLLDFVGGQHTSYSLAPKEFILGSTSEYVMVPNWLVARIEGKSSLARKGLMVHTAGFIDPGFRGTLTLEITNHSDIPFQLKRGMRIAQLAFQELDTPALRPYGHPELKSHYQGQHGATPSRV